MKLLRPFVCAGIAILAFASVSSTCSWDYLIWIPRNPNADPLYRFKDGDKVGYIDQTGKVVIPPTLHSSWGNDGGEFHDGLLEVGSRYGNYVDTNGKKVTWNRSYHGWDFSEGLAIATEKEGSKYGYINTTGEFVISPRFNLSPTDYVSSFEGGFAKIEIAGKTGYIDHTGQFVIQPRFLDGDSFHEGLARVVVEGPCVHFNGYEVPGCPGFQLLPRDSKTEKDVPSCRYTFIDTSGNIVFDQRFDHALPFAEGLAPVKVGEKWGYINKKGTMVISPRFERAEPFSDGYGLVHENGMAGFIDRTGTYVVSPQFTYAEGFKEGRAVVGSDATGYWYIDQNGNQAISGKFAAASSFFKGLAHVRFMPTAGEAYDGDSGTFAYIDIHGRIIFTYKVPSLP